MLRKRQTKKTQEIEKLYQNNKISYPQKPASFSKKMVLITIILAIVFGLIAGIAGGFLILITRKIKIPFNGEYNLDQYLPKREIVLETVKNVTVTPDIRTHDVIKAVQPEIVDIFVKKEPDREVLKQIYQTNEILGKGIILTSDGWIITLKNIIETGEEAKNYVMMTSEGNVYPIKKILFDPLTEIAFVKTEAKDLSVAKLAEKENITIGQGVLVFSNNGILNTEISRLNYYNIKEGKDIIKSTEKFSDFIALTNKFDNLSKGGPVVDMNGTVVGLVVDDNFVAPVFYLRNLITQVLKRGESLKNESYLARPYLGVGYIDLAVHKGIYDARFKGLSSGALVYGSPPKGSPARIAGIKNADVVLKVNEDSMNSHKNLSELIWEYEPESTLELVVLRNGKKQKIDVVLEKMGNL